MKSTRDQRCLPCKSTTSSPETWDGFPSVSRRKIQVWTRTQHYQPLDRKRCQPQGEVGNEEGVSKLSSLKVIESGTGLWGVGCSNGRLHPLCSWYIGWVLLLQNRPNLTVSQIRRMFTFLSTVSPSDPAGMTGPRLAPGTPAPSCLLAQT